MLRTAIVAAVVELGDVLPSMLLRNVNVSAEHGALEVRPMALKRVRVVYATHPFFCFVVDDAVRVMLVKVAIGAMFVR